MKAKSSEPVTGDTLLVLLNGHHEPIPFALPSTNADQHWELLYDTADDAAGPTPFAGQATYPLRDRSLALFRTVPVAVEAPQVTPLQAESLRREAATAAANTLPRAGT